MGLGGNRLCEWLGRERRCGEQLGCGLPAQGILRVEPMGYARRRGLDVLPSAQTPNGDSCMASDCTTTVCTISSVASRVLYSCFLAAIVLPYQPMPFTFSRQHKIMVWSLVSVHTTV